MPRGNPNRLLVFKIRKRRGIKSKLSLADLATKERNHEEKFLESVRNLTQKELEEVLRLVDKDKKVELREAVKKFDLGPMGSSVCPMCGK